MTKPDEINFLSECLEKPYKTELLYRASRDGYTSRVFHKKCDNKGASITIIQSEHGLMFGGFTSLSWENSESWKIDQKDPFVFSLTKKTQHLNYSKENSIRNSS